MIKSSVKLNLDKIQLAIVVIVIRKCTAIVVITISFSISRIKCIIRATGCHIRTWVSGVINIARRKIRHAGAVAVIFKCFRINIFLLGHHKPKNKNKNKNSDDKLKEIVIKYLTCPIKTKARNKTRNKCSRNNSRNALRYFHWHRQGFINLFAGFNVFSRVCILNISIFHKSILSIKHTSIISKTNTFNHQKEGFSA